MPALLFGSIGTIAETSELQREAFNDAFRQHGLDWEWSPEEYRSLLRESGGRARIAAYAQSRGEDVDAAAVHATKSELFREKLAAGTLTPHPGVAETVAEARARGYRVGLVTTTSPENVSALAKAVAPAVDLDAFDVTVSLADVREPKPDPEAYRFALAHLGTEPADAVAVEDNLGGVAAARAAGLTVLAFPGANTATHDFAQANARVDTLSLDELNAAGAAS